MRLVYTYYYNMIIIIKIYYIHTIIVGMLSGTHTPCITEESPILTVVGKNDECNPDDDGGKTPFPSQGGSRLGC